MCRSVSFLLRIIKSGDLTSTRYNELPEPNKSLMTWLMDVLADAAMEERVNKMSPRNFCM